MNKKDDEIEGGQEPPTHPALLAVGLSLFGAKEPSGQRGEEGPGLKSFFKKFAAPIIGPTDEVELASPDGMSWVAAYKDSTDFSLLIEAGWIELTPGSRGAQLIALMPKAPLFHITNIRTVPGVSEPMRESILEGYRRIRDTLENAQDGLEKKWERWAADKPPNIQRLFVDYPLNKLHQIKQTGQIVVISCYWDDGSIGVRKHAPSTY